MARKVIKIDYGIGFWGYGKQLLKLDLEGTEEEGVVIEISSLGGDLYHALDMHNQIAKHGNVEVVFTGPSASAATILAMGAKKVSIIDNVFFLIHKVMAVVDNWGMFNEEELDKLIEDLKTLRTENQKFDQVVARIYQKKTGMDMDAILAEMKKDTWMTADEAKELGFVDEIIEPSEKYNYLSERFMAMVKAVDLPPIPEIPEMNLKQNTMRQFEKLNTLLEVEELQANEEGCYLNEEQLKAVENRLNAIEGIEDDLNDKVNSADILKEAALQALETTKQELTNAQATIAANQVTIETMTQQHAEEVSALQAQVAEGTSRIQYLTSEAEASGAQFADLVAQLDGIDPSVSAAPSHADKVAAIRTLLSKAPGATPPGILQKDQKAGLKTGEVDWDTINKLPHNRKADTIR